MKNFQVKNNSNAYLFILVLELDLFQYIRKRIKVMTEILKYLLFELGLDL